MTGRQPQDLVLVAGHAAFESSVSEVPLDPEADAAWVLQDFQIGEPPFYLEHIRRGIVLAANNPAALLLFSGGRTREAAGEWSEAKTYYSIATARRFWIPDKMQATRDDVERRTATEEFAKDSFENLLFGICRFCQIVGSYPRTVTVVNWAFKATRFDLHRASIRFPAYRFRFVAVNDPIDLPTALEGERTTALGPFTRFPFGSSGELLEKRARRNPFGQVNEYGQCPGLGDFFKFITDPATAEKPYAGDLPWGT